MTASVLHRNQVVGVKKDDSQCAAQSSDRESEARWQPI